MNDKKHFCPEIEAKDILADHTEGFLNISCEEDAINSMTTEEMFEEMYKECAYILTSKYIEGDYTIKEYYLVRAELAKLLDELVSREPNYTFKPASGS
jgi:hypothetical protein